MPSRLSCTMSLPSLLRRHVSMSCATQRKPPGAISRALLASTRGTLSTSAAVHEAGKGVMANNDPAESSFGAITQEINAFGRIAFGTASGLCAHPSCGRHQYGALLRPWRYERAA
eukprot:884997-Pleurochrysis_carterae.AAC.4